MLQGQELFAGSGQLVQDQPFKMGGDGWLCGLQEMFHNRSCLLQLALLFEDVLELVQQLWNGVGDAWASVNLGGDSGCRFREGKGRVKVEFSAPLPLLTHPGTAAEGPVFLVKVETSLPIAITAAMAVRVTLAEVPWDASTRVAASDREVCSVFSLNTFSGSMTEAV